MLSHEERGVKQTLIFIYDSCSNIRLEAMVYGEKAHSCYFSRDVFAKLTGDNKELIIIPGAIHTDLYDRMDIIPFATSGSSVM